MKTKYQNKKNEYDYTYFNFNVVPGPVPAFNTVRIELIKFDLKSAISAAVAGRVVTVTA
jgi:hypothetical protein